MEQVDWVDVSLPRPPGPLTDTPRARNTDPATSHQAAAKIGKSGRLRAQQLLVLRALRCCPGSTAVELADSSGLDRYLISRRLPELVPVWARRGKSRICTVAGTPQTTWHPVYRESREEAA